jgi:hypothetical protein
MRIPRFGLAILSASLLVIELSIPAGNAAEELQPIDRQDTVWIFGTDVNGYGCWSLSTTKQVPTLQVKLNGKWITKAKARLSKDTSKCSDPKYPWVARYRWIVDELGEIPHNGNRSRDIVAREFIPKTGSYKSFAGTPFVKQVYRNQAELEADYSDAIYDALGGSSSSGIAGSSSSKISGCYFKGKKLYGKVQIVDYFPDIKVQVVDYFPDLKVQKVDYFPTSCGKWQFVDYFPDIKIQFVDYFPDIKIQFVDYFPGLP